MIEFPAYASALACYRSPEYQANIKVRQPHSTVDMIIVEGYDGPQPQLLLPTIAAPVYRWFTKGFDTLDLKEAKALLDELRAV